MLKTFDFVFVGNEHPIKGIDRLDELIGKCVGRYSFALVGHLPQLKYKWEGAKEIYFFGIQKGQWKKDILSRSKVFVLTSYHESFSMTLCEALSLGKLSIAFNIPTLKSVYNNGVYFADDIEEFWKAMTILSRCTKNIDFGYNFNWLTEAKKVLE